MAGVFTKRKRSEVMARIRGRGNKDTELALATLLRAHKIWGWRRHVEVRGEKEIRPHFAPHPSPFPRASGFCLPQATDGTLCGWLFLARLPAAWDEAEEQSRVLAEETRRQQTSRCGCLPNIAAGRVAGRADLGARTEEGRGEKSEGRIKPGDPPDSAGFASGLRRRFWVGWRRRIPQDDQIFRRDRRGAQGQAASI